VHLAGPDRCRALNLAALCVDASKGKETTSGTGRNEVRVSVEEMPARVRRAVLAACAVLTLLASLALLPAPHAGALDADGQDWLAKINGLRTSLGLGPLQLDGELTGLAQSWAEHMAATGTLSHTPNLASGVSSDWTKLGENVGFGPNNDLIWNGFLNSPKHYANLTDPAFTHVGIGVAWVGGTEWVVHRFMAVGDGGGGSYEPSPPPPPVRRSSPPATSAPAPDPTPTPAEPPPPPPPVADTGRVAAVLDALHAAGT
jgi:uncharacterized protein YkwD